MTFVTPSATSLFRRPVLPNAIDGDRSTTIQVVSARSGTCWRTCGTPVRALAAGSIIRTSSPDLVGPQLRELGARADADAAVRAGQAAARPPCEREVERGDRGRRHRTRALTARRG